MSTYPNMKIEHHQLLKIKTKHDEIKELNINQRSMITKTFSNPLKLIMNIIRRNIKDFI